MSGFRPERGADGRLRVAGCDAVALAEEHGTPLQLYDAGALRARARAIKTALAAALPGRETVVAFASKACPLPPVLRVLAQEDVHCDVASGNRQEGELAVLVDHTHGVDLRPAVVFSEPGCEGHCGSAFIEFEGCDSW